VVRARASYEDSLVKHSSGEPLVTHRHTHRRNRRNRRNKHKHQRHSKKTQTATPGHVIKLDHVIKLELRRQCEPRMQRGKTGLRWRRRAVRSKTMPPIHKSASSLFCSSPWSLSLFLSLSLSLRAHSLPTGEQREQSREQRIGTGSRPRDCTQKTVCSLQARKTV
jgi:hypothetical protein